MERDVSGLSERPEREGMQTQLCIRSPEAATYTKSRLQALLRRWYGKQWDSYSSTDIDVAVLSL
ncbi:hypothetical protein CFB49_09780 [Burkholderia sp. AU17457]|nr:hypothetical protein CFB49_09780 [Burkholderia sp. AU17457]